MRAMKAILFVAFLLLVLNPTNAHALECMELPPIEEAYEKYDAILIGIVEELTTTNENNKIKLNVVKSYKGIIDISIQVQENMFWGSILVGLSEVGQENLYFLRQTESGWENPLCSPTKKIADASDELIYLQDKEIPLNTISAPTEPPSNNMTNIEPLVSVEVIEDDPSPSTNWTVIILIGAALLIVLGIVIYRLVKRGK